MNRLEAAIENDSRRPCLCVLGYSCSVGSSNRALIDLVEALFGLQTRTKDCDPMSAIRENYNREVWIHSRISRITRNIWKAHLKYIEKSLPLVFAVLPRPKLAPRPIFPDPPRHMPGGTKPEAGTSVWITWAIHCHTNYTNIRNILQHHATIINHHQPCLISCLVIFRTKLGGSLSRLDGFLPVAKLHASLQEAGKVWLSVNGTTSRPSCTYCRSLLAEFIHTYIHTYITLHHIPLHCIAFHYVTLLCIYIYIYIYIYITYIPTYVHACMHPCMHRYIMIHR